MKKLLFILRYLSHRIKCIFQNNAISPFTTELLTSVIKVEQKYYSYLAIEKLRETLLDSKQKIEVHDFGAAAQKQKIKTIRSIASQSAKPPQQAQLLFRLVNYFQAQNILELGTSLGLTTCYLAMANSKAKITTIEGCPNISKVATENFKKLKLKNINIITGNIDNVLSEVISHSSNLDFVFFDGNHKKGPTINYFQQCLECSNVNSVFVFDDIYWSNEMTEAWETIKKHPSVKLTIDMFYMGLVFFKNDKEKEHIFISI